METAASSVSSAATQRFISMSKEQEPLPQLLEKQEQETEQQEEEQWSRKAHYPIPTTYKEVVIEYKVLMPIEA